MEFTKGELRVKVFEDSKQMGEAAAKDIIAEINATIEKNKECRIIFAAAPSQNETLKILRETNEVDFSKVIAFHMDEYHTLPLDSDKRFKHFLSQAIFNHHKFKKIHFLCNQKDISVEEQIKDYENLLTEKPIDICICGIGENGHIAFNEPKYADFNDPKIIKEIELDEVCRNQQFHDAKYSSIDLVPRRALTLTIPILLNASRVFCIVPGIRKREAVNKTLNDEISTKCPSTVLKRHSNAILYVDKQSYKGE